MHTIFRLSNLLVMPFWATMILLPGRRWTKRIMQSPVAAAAPAVLYVALVMPRLGEIWPAVAHPTLGQNTPVSTDSEPQSTCIIEVNDRETSGYA